MGSWQAQLYGPSADTADPEAKASTVPSGVAGKFDAKTTNSGDGTYNSRVVGAFAATEE